MKLLSFLFFSLFLLQLGNAQPFDTLLLQYNRIAKVYPLADQTFLVLGVKDDIKLERIDAKANVIWSTFLISTERDEI